MSVPSRAPLESRTAAPVMMINRLSNAPLGSPTAAGTFPTDCGSCCMGTWGELAIETPLYSSRVRSGRCTACEDPWDGGCHTPHRAPQKREGTSTELTFFP